MAGESSTAPFTIKGLWRSQSDDLESGSIPKRGLGMEQDLGIDSCDSYDVCYKTTGGVLVVIL